MFGLQLATAMIHPMKKNFLEFLSKILRNLPPEFAHDLLIRALRNDWVQKNFCDVELDISSIKNLSMNIPGVGQLMHPVGLAAGFDKNGEVINSLKNFQFSFLEVGAITIRPQIGNPKPRIFRLREINGLVNAMGFNNCGLDTFYQRLQKFKRQQNFSFFPVGINLGINKDVPLEQAHHEYSFLVHRLWEEGSFFVVNISSPNTKNLRTLAEPEFIERLALELSGKLNKVWIKLDPDLDKKSFQKLIEKIVQCGFQGVILTNTSKVKLPYSGGVSGSPINISATEKLEWAWEVHQGALPMIGVGGIMTGRDIFEKIIRGALAVEIYTAFVYRGPFTVVKLLQELNWELGRRGFHSLEEAHQSYYL